MLTETRRFADTNLPDVLSCMRSGKPLSQALRDEFCKCLVGNQAWVDGNGNDKRFKLDEWLDASYIAIPWALVSREMQARVRRDAKRCGEVVVYCQAVDVPRGEQLAVCEPGAVCGETDWPRVAQAVGAIGAVIMPHNLYLHSSLVLSRKVSRDKPHRVHDAIWFSRLESAGALLLSFFINLALVTTNASHFYSQARARPALPHTLSAVNRDYMHMYM